MNYDASAMPLKPAIGTRPTWRAYLELTKPRIIELLLVTTVPTMILSADGWPGLSLLIATLIGGSLAAGSANAYNMYLDRDIDRLMQRTQQRPLVTGEISDHHVIVFASILGALSLAWFAIVVNWESAALALAAIFIYVVFYTLVLKRRTPQNIVWGGAAGCMPVLIGWTAVTGTLSWTPWVLFLIIFLWTPPHYWPLSMRFREDYARAGVPMLPVVAENTQVARKIIVYTAAMIGATVVLIPIAGMGLFYAVIAIGAGIWFLTTVLTLFRRVQQPGAEAPAMRVFHGSIVYLALIFAAVAIDPFLPL